MAEHGARSAGQHGGHPYARLGQASPSDRIDPAMNGIQPFAIQPMLDGAAAQPEPAQLRMRHDAMVRVGELTKEGVHRARSHFDSYVMSK